MSRRTGRSLRRALTGLAGALVCALGLGGCGMGASDEPVKHTADLDGLCTGTYFTKAAKVSEDGPQKIIVFEETGGRLQDGPSSRQHFSSTGDNAAPENWWKLSDASSIPLVACAAVSEVGEQIGTCEFRSTQVPQKQATFEVTVYEARTGQEVGKTKLVGNERSCPMIINYRDGDDPELYATPTARQYVEALSKFVDR